VCDQIFETLAQLFYLLEGYSPLDVQGFFTLLVSYFVETWCHFAPSPQVLLCCFQVEFYICCIWSYFIETGVNFLKTLMLAG